MLDLLRDAWPGIATVLIVIALIWCVAYDVTVNQVDEGVVIGKECTPARRSMTTVWTGKSAAVIPVNHAEKWEIQVQGLNQNGEERTDWWAVSESMYNYIGIGDYVFREGGAICVEGVEK